MQGHPLPGNLYRYASQEKTPATLKINGQATDVLIGEDGYVSLNRTWKPSDVIELDFPMPAQRVLSNEKITANKGLVALMRGPLVYCFEGLDNRGVDLFEAKLPRDSTLTSLHRPDLLGGVTVIKVVSNDKHGEASTFTAIPYHAWANRGRTPMNIWMREKDQKE